jgi:chromosome partitioning protein
MILAISHHAGGVGKTHLALNLGYQLARAGKIVLLVDLDPQADLSRRLGVQPTTPSLADVMASGKGFPTPVELAWNGATLWLLPADLNMAGVEPLIIGKNGADQRLKRVLAQSRAEYILIDCAPSLSLLTMNAWHAADGLLIPVQGEDKAYKALDLLYTTLQDVNEYRRPPLEVFGIVGTKVDTREKMGGEIMAALRQNYPATFQTFIPVRSDAKLEGRHRAPVSYYDKSSEASRAYAALAEEVIRRGN